MTQKDETQTTTVDVVGKASHIAGHDVVYNEHFKTSTTSVFIICATVFLILFLGEPSLMDTIKNLIIAYTKRI